MTPDEASALVRDAVLGPHLRRATFAGAARFAASPWVRVTVRPVRLKGRPHLQLAYFDGKKTVTRNLPPADAGPPLGELLAVGFAGVHVTTAAEEIDVRTSKKGQVTVGRRPAAADAVAPVDEHNRVKDLPLPEGRADRVLEAMGVLTSAGRVRPAMRAKFTQINEFLKHLRHALPDAGLGGLGRPVDILDAGCGASYLTLAAHHYLNDVLGLPARVAGVDVNDEVVRKSMAKAARLGPGGPAFACGPIAGGDGPVDVVVALHACDTATDDALARAVRGGARLILAAPCCHRHLNARLSAAGPAEAFRAVFRHGILRERTADLVTDALRAAALRVCGYRADVVEFVSPDHTARNLLIRAVGGRPAGSSDAVADYRRLRDFWGQVPYLERALGESFAGRGGG